MEITKYVLGKYDTQIVLDESFDWVLCCIHTHAILYGPHLRTWFNGKSSFNYVDVNSLVD